MSRLLGRLGSTQRVMTALVTEPTLEGGLEVIMEEAINQLGAEAVRIWAVNAASASESVTCLASYARPSDARGPGIASTQGHVRTFRHHVPIKCFGNVLGRLEIVRSDACQGDVGWDRFAELLADQAALVFDRARLCRELEVAREELSRAHDEVVESLCRLLDLRGGDIEGHSQRVAGAATQLAREMGLGGDALVHIRRGALLHDIGKLGVPDAILQKPGPLNDEEWSIMRRHPEYASDVLSQVGLPPADLEIPRFHHERWDGTGYPDKLAKDDIPLSARIFAAVDIWDALSHDRSYRKAWPPNEIISHIKLLSGTHLDPCVSSAFLDFVGRQGPVIGQWGVGAA